MNHIFKKNRHKVFKSPCLNHKSAILTQKMLFFLANVKDKFDSPFKFFCFASTILDKKTRRCMADELLGMVRQEKDREELLSSLQRHFFLEDCNFIKIPDEIEHAFCNNDLSNLMQQSTHIGAFLSDIECKGKEKHKIKDRKFQRRLANLATIFRLDKVETDIVEFAYMCVLFEYFWKSLQEHHGGQAQELISFLAAMLGHPVKKVADALWPFNGRLAKFELINLELLQYNIHIEKRGLLNERYVWFLHGMLEETVQQMTCEAMKTEARSHDKFPVPERIYNIITSLLVSTDPASILLYGPAGTGKTTFSATIARQNGRVPYLLKSRQNCKNMTTQLKAAFCAINASTDVLIIDEADEILNMVAFSSDTREYINKGWLNQFIEENKVKVIWITNRTNCIEESTLRRFDFTYEFPTLNVEQRMEVWNYYLDLHGVGSHLDPLVVRQLSSTFASVPSGIESAVRNMARLVQTQDAAEKPMALHDHVSDMLAQQAKLLGHHRKAPMLGQGSQYDIRVINADHDPEKIIHGAARFMQGLSAGKTDLANLSILLYGEPGTGKTEFAKHSSAALGLELLHKRASDILGKYVGESEKNVAGMFHEATSKNAILFLDEADSIIPSRENAHRNWEVSLINEVLVQMENFRGIFICSTNFEDILDKASLRRFALKVKFNRMRPEQARMLFSKIFGADIGSADIPGLPAFEKLPPLTPGDFKVVRQKVLLGQIECTSESLLGHLSREATALKKGHKIGF